MATNYYWDSDGVTAGGSANTVAAGTWGTSAFWSTAVNGDGATFIANPLITDDLFFSASNDVTGAYTVTVNAAQVAKTITFEEGTVTLNGGDLTLGTGLTVGTTNGNNVITTAAAVINSTLQGTTGLIKAGGNTLTVSGTNTFTGNVVVNTGALIINNFSTSGNSALGDVSNTVTVNRGGSLVANYAGSVDQALLGRIVNTSAGGVALANGQTNTNALDFTAYASLTLGANGNATYNGVLTPNGNTYRFGGGNGTLNVASALVTTNPIAILNPATVRFTNAGITNNLGEGGILIQSNGNGGTGSSGSVYLQLAGNNQLSETGTITIEANNGQNTGLQLNNFSDTVGSLIMRTSTNAGAIVQTGATGVLTLSTDLSLNNNRNANDNGNSGRHILITGSGATGTAAYDGTLDLGGVLRTINVATTAAAQAGNINADATIETNIRNGGINKTGGQTLYLRAMNSTYAGGTTINAGGVGIASDRSLGAVPASFDADNILIAGNGALTVLANSVITNPNRGVTIAGGVSGVFDARGANDILQIDGVISGAGNFVRGQTPSIALAASAGTVVLNATNIYTGTTTIANGTLMIGAGGTTGSVPGPIDFTPITGVNPTLIFNRSDTVTQPGVITNSGVGNGGLTKFSNGTLILNAANTYRGNTNVYRGILRLDFGAPGAPANNIINNVANSSALILGGGKVELVDANAGTHTQQFNGATVTNGYSTLSVAAGITTTLGAIARPTAGNNDFGGANITGSGTVTTTNANTSGILGGWITRNGTDWVANDGVGNIIVLPTYTPDAWAAGNNTDVTGDSAPAAASTTNSLRLNGAASTVTLTGANTVTSGGILMGSGAAGNMTIAGGAGNTLTSGNATDLIIHQNSTVNKLTISAPIVGGISLSKNGPGEVELTGTNTLTSRLFVNDGTLTISGPTTTLNNFFVHGGTLQVNSNVTTTAFISIGIGNDQAGTMTVNNGTVTVPGDFNVSDVINSRGTLNINNGTVQVNTLYIGKNNNAVGIVNQSGGTMQRGATGGDWRIGGAATADNRADAMATGIYNLSGGLLTTASNFQIGANGNGTVNQTGGTFRATGGFTVLGRYTSAVGTWNISNGVFDTDETGAGASTILGELGRGTFNISDTADVQAKTLILGLGQTGAGTVNQTGGTVTLSAATGVQLANNVTATGTYNLSGGTLSTPVVTKGVGNGTFNFNGGTLRATANSNNYLANIAPAVQAGGAKIDTNGFDISVNSLQHDSALGATPDGGLTKNGAGTLFVGSSTITGGMTVNAGTLLLSSVPLTSAGTTTINGGTLRLTNAAVLPEGVTPALRFDGANAGSVVVDGANNVSLWADQGAQGNNAFLPSGVVAPVYNPAGLNGKGTITFSGGTGATSSRLETTQNTDISGATARTLFTVMARGNGNLFVHTGEQGTNLLAFGTSLETANTFFYTWGTGNDVTTGTVQQQNNFIFTSQRYDGTSLSGFLNGNFVNQLNVAANTTNTPLMLGSRHNVANTAFGSGNGTIAEVLMYSTALSMTDRLAVEAYLNYKWFNTGATSNLLPASTPVVIGNGGTLDLNGVNQTIGSLNGVAGSTVLLGSGTLTTGTNNTAETFAGTISGTGGLTKTGNSSLTLTDAHNYTGPTTVNSGTLLVNGSLSGTAVTVNAGGTIGGTGSIITENQLFTLAAGGKLSPGISAGILTVDTGTAQFNVSNAIATDASGAFLFELGSLASSDKIVLSGSSALNIGSGFLEFDDFSFSPLAGFGAGTYVLFDSNTLITGSLGPDRVGTVGGFNATLGIAPGGQDVILTVVPEPGSAMLILGGLAIAGARRRRSER